MPKKIEARLRRAASKKRGWSKERKNAYVYGGLTNIKKRMKRKRVYSNSRKRRS